MRLEVTGDESQGRHRFLAPMSDYGTASERRKVRDPLTHGIIGCAITVHKEMGPGLPEGVYEECMGREMSRRGVEFTRQTVMTLTYDGRPVGRSFRTRGRRGKQRRRAQRTEHRDTEGSVGVLCSSS